MASTPTPGAKTVVPAGANLQLALNNAHCGDTLLLQAGATFTGIYNLPAKACDDQHWIVIRTSAPDSALPAEGKRISPCYAGVASLPGRPSSSCAAPKNVMAKLVASTAGPVTLVGGANHYRLGPGLEITRPLNSTMYVAWSPRADRQSNVIDRDWIHGVPQYDTVRGVMLSGITYAAVVDSYINDFHCAAQSADVKMRKRLPVVPAASLKVFGRFTTTFWKARPKIYCLGVSALIRSPRLISRSPIIICSSR